MSEKTAKSLRKIQDRDMVKNLVIERNKLADLVNLRTKQANMAAEGLKALAKKIVSVRAEISPLRFAVNQDPYIRGQERIRALEEAFSLVTGIPHSSEKFESTITIGAK